MTIDPKIVIDPNRMGRVELPSATDVRARVERLGLGGSATCDVLREALGG